VHFPLSRPVPPAVLLGLRDSRIGLIAGLSAYSVGGASNQITRFPAFCPTSGPWGLRVSGGGCSFGSGGGCSFGGPV